MIYLFKILIIDDEKDILDLFSQFFTNSGFICDPYSDPLLALHDFIKNNDNYDLVISDIRMPKMDGVDLAYNIRKMNKDIPIILMTAFDVIDIEDSHLKFLNIEDVISKPVKLKDLLEKVDTIK